MEASSFLLAFREPDNTPAPRLPPRILINPSGAPSGGRLQLSRLSKTSFSLNPLGEKLHRKQTALKLTLVLSLCLHLGRRRNMLFVTVVFVSFHQSRNQQRLRGRAAVQPSGDPE